MIGEEVGQIAVVFVEDILWVFRLQYESNLNFHELFADVLMHLGQYREPLLIAQEWWSCKLNGKYSLSEESIDDLAIGKVRSKHNHAWKEDTVLDKMFKF